MTYLVKSFRALLSTVLMLISFTVVAQDVSVSVGSSRTIIPPYIRDLESALDLFLIDLNCNFQQATEVLMVIELTEDELGRIAFGESEVMYIPNTSFQRTISNTEFTQWDTWEFDENMKQQFLETNRLPDGVYNLCVEVIPVDNPAPLSQFCYLFEIFLPNNVQLIMPDDESDVVVETPNFVWTPVNWMTPLNYFLKVVEIFQGQTPQDAMATNQPLAEHLLLQQTSYLYSMQDLPLEEGKSYAWQVTSVDEFDNAIGENGGESEVFSFNYVGNAMGGDLNTWQDSVRRFTDPAYLQGASLKKDPCPPIKELIASIQSKLLKARAKHQKASLKKAEGETQASNGKAAKEDADNKMGDAQKKHDQANQQRDGWLSAANNSTGAKVIKANDDCSGGALIGAGNGGSLKLDAGTALCIPSSKISAWLAAFNKVRSEYEASVKALAEAAGKLADLKAQKEQGEKDEKDGKDKAAEGKSEAEAAQKEIDELEKALQDLEPAAKECDEIIKNLKAAAAKANSAISDAGSKLVGPSDKGYKGGSAAGGHVKKGEDKLKEAQDAFEKGDYTKAETLAAEAGLEAGKSGIAADREDCYEEAKEKVEKAKQALADGKKKNPKSDYGVAEKALADAEKALAELKAAIADGDYGRAEMLCNRVMQIITNEFYPPFEAIVCNEGDVIPGQRKFITEYKAGYFYTTTQLAPGNIGFELKKFFTAIRDPLGIASMVNSVYALSSTGHAYDIYEVWVKSYGTSDSKCVNGVWVDQNLRDIYREAYLVKVKETVRGEEISKIMVEQNFKNIHNSFLDIKIDKFIEKIQKHL